MKRRHFVLSAATVAGAGVGLFIEQERIAGTVDYPGRNWGHRLRDTRELPAPSQTIETNVLIAGSGVAGLTAAWQLAKHGVTDVLMISGPEPHGNAAGGRSDALQFPTGAHYLPLPSMESTHVREMLAEFSIIQQDPYGERPTFDERYLVHAPAERVLFRNTWQDGYLPAESVGAAERTQHDRFFAIVDQFLKARGSDGRRAFVVPLELSSRDPQFLALDRLDFKTWLFGLGLTAPTLHWYLDYCCRDDYGRHYDEVSAWAGLHYFCGRDGQASNADRGAVLTWPEGLSALTAQLEAAATTTTQWRAASVASLRRASQGVEALIIEEGAGAPRVTLVKARAAIAAMPLFILQHVLHDAPSYGFVGSRDVPAYAPWLVSNFLMHAFPEEQPGVPLSWDNVVYREPGLGYVVSTHQDIRMSRPERTSFTAYHALSDRPPEAGRRWLEAASMDQLVTMAARDLRLAYGWRLPLCVERVAITVRGHAMAVPAPGFLSNSGSQSLRDANGPIFFAHSDLSGLSLFEEASWWGHRAAAKLAAVSA